MSSESSLLGRIAEGMSSVEQIAGQVESQVESQGSTRPGLPASDLEGGGAGRDCEAFVAPRTPTEEKLAGIWAESLGLERISIHDDFFELGGHSVLAMQALSRVRAVFQVELPLTVLFANDFTVAEIAKAIEQRQIEKSSPEEISELLEELEDISDEEARVLLAHEGEGLEIG
jgi:hypothetical protein